MRLRELTVYAMLAILAALLTSCAQERDTVGGPSAGTDGASAAVHDAPASSSGLGPEEEKAMRGLEEFVAAEGGPERRLERLVRGIHDAMSIEHLQAWARPLVEAADARELKDSKASERQWLTREDIYQPLRSMGDPVMAAIIAESAGQSRVEIIWRDIDGFRGISLGFEGLKPTEESGVVRQLAPGAFAWVSE